MTAERSPIAPFGGLECDLVLANIGDLYGRHERAPNPLWQKATLLPVGGDEVVVVGPELFARELAPEICGVGTIHHIVPRRSTRELGSDLLSDDRAWGTLLAYLRSRPGVGAVRIVSQVYGPSVEEVVRRIEADLGVLVDRTQLSQASGGTVHHWNTKVGGRSLLLSVAELSDWLVPSTVCSTIPELVALAADNPTLGYVVKADVGMGGAGVRILRPDRERAALAMAEEMKGWIADSTGVGAARVDKGVTAISGPFLLEQLVGEPATNTSPTIDLLIDHEGARPVAAATQVLRDGTHYVGAAWTGRSASLDRCCGAAVVVGEALHARGYRGLANVDFVVTADGHERLVELNVRQSAPLDQAIVMHRLHGAGWRDDLHYVALEDGGDGVERPGDVDDPFHLPPVTLLTYRDGTESTIFPRSIPLSDTTDER